MHGVEPTAVDPFLNGPLRYRKRGQLPSPHDPVLPVRQRRNLPSQTDVSELSHDMSWLSSDTPGFVPLVGTDRRVVGVANVAAMAGDTISFARGAPSADILPRDAVRDAA